MLFRSACRPPLRARAVAGALAAAVAVVNALPSSGSAADHEIAIGPLEFGEIRPFSLDLSEAGIVAADLESIESTCRCLEVLRYPTAAAPVLGGRYLGVAAGEMDAVLRLHAGGGQVKEIAFLGRVAPGDPALAAVGTVEPEVFLRRSAPDRIDWRIAHGPAKKLLAEGGIALVDLRDADAYFAAHIDGAVRLPAHELAGASFLRRKDAVILTGNAFPSAADERALAQLRAAASRRLVPARRTGAVAKARRQAGGRAPAARRRARPRARRSIRGGRGASGAQGRRSVTFADRYLLPGATWFACDQLRRRRFTTSSPRANCRSLSPCPPMPQSSLPPKRSPRRSRMPTPGSCPAASNPTETISPNFPPA
ncbi:MAG: rhodanese-like domain-containing protein [Verrucomicrobiales bacterium]